MPYRFHKTELKALQNLLNLEKALILSFGSSSIQRGSNFNLKRLNVMIIINVLQNWFSPGRNPVMASICIVVWIVAPCIVARSASVITNHAQSFFLRNDVRIFNFLRAQVLGNSVSTQCVWTIFQVRSHWTSRLWKRTRIENVILQLRTYQETITVTFLILFLRLHQKQPWVLPLCYLFHEPNDEEYSSLGIFLFIFGEFFGDGQSS